MPTCAAPCHQHSSLTHAVTFCHLCGRTIIDRGRQQRPQSVKSQWFCSMMSCTMAECIQQQNVDAFLQEIGTFGKMSDHTDRSS